MYQQFHRGLLPHETAQPPSMAAVGKGNVNGIESFRVGWLALVSYNALFLLTFRRPCLKARPWPSMATVRYFTNLLYLVHVDASGMGAASPYPRSLTEPVERSATGGSEILKQS